MTREALLNNVAELVKSKLKPLVDEAAREKIKHFLRKFILFFVSLFVILFHFFKSDGDVAFYFTNYI